MEEEHFIHKLRNALSESITRKLNLTAIDEGIFHISFEEFPQEILCYANHIKKRISGEYPAPTIHLDQDQIEFLLPKIGARLKGIMHCEHKIFARQTVVARINKNVSLEFQEEHHLQLPIAGKYRYGLFYQGELVSIAVFSAGRKMSGQPDTYRSFELIRFCHKNSLLVVGGLSKLIHAFAKDFPVNDLMTYVDLDWTQNSNLTSLGFKEKGRIAPQFYWINGAERKIFKLYEHAVAQQQIQQTGHVKSNSGSIKMVLEL